MLLFILPVLSGGGAERVTLNFLTELKKRGHSVELLVFSMEGPLASSIPSDIVVHNLATGSLRHSLSGLIRAIRNLKPRIVFSTLGYVNLALLSVRPLLPRKTKIWVREANLPSISLRNNSFSHLMWLGYRYLYRTADVVFCTSERMRIEFFELFKLSYERLTILPNPIDIEKIRGTINEPCRTKGDGNRFISAGRLTHQKGYDRLLEWFAALGDPSAHLTILGDGAEKSKLEEKSKSLGINGQVDFRGFMEQPWPLFAGADAYLLSSRWEGMPNGALEALACGSPVIATPESGGIAEVESAAAPHAVKLAAAGKSFIEAMRAVKPRPQLILYPSLLPQEYLLSTAVDRLESWLHDAG